MRARALLALAVLAVSSALVAVALLTRSSSGEEEFTGVPAVDPGPIHVHGLGIDPSDGALFLATHTGLYRVDPIATKARRVGDRQQDTMGFTVVGPKRFLGSGHPDAREAQERGLPPHLGLIESRDGGLTWRSVSLLGEADLHVIRSVGNRVYGYDGSNDRLLASSDGGEHWRELRRPAPLVDLVADPDQPTRLVAAGLGQLERGIYSSLDGGMTWKKLSDAVALLAWPESDRLYLVDGVGNVYASPDRGRTQTAVGAIGGEPAALLAAARDELYVALHDGTIKRSSDGGKSWVVRARP